MSAHLEAMYDLFWQDRFQDLHGLGVTGCAAIHETMHPAGIGLELEMHFNACQELFALDGFAAHCMPLSGPPQHWQLTWANRMLSRQHGHSLPSICNGQADGVAPKFKAAMRGCFPVPSFYGHFL